MSEGCVNCWVKEADRSKETILKAAQAHADKTGEPTAIYRDGTEWKFINAFTAAAEGIPFAHVVSTYSGSSPT